MKRSGYQQALPKLQAIVALSLMLHVCCGTEVSLSRQQQPLVMDEQAKKLRDAEEVTDNFVRRLHETLDYGVPFREMFVIDPKLLDKSEVFFGLGPEAEQLYGKGVPERLHVAFMNVWYLRNVCYTIHRDKAADLPKEMKALGAEELFPGINNSKPKGKMSLAAVKLEVEKQIAQLNRLAGMFRQKLPPGVFDLPAYKSGVEAYQEASRKQGRLARVEYGSQFVKLPKSVPVYIVRREFMDYYLVEEHGRLKVIFIHILPDFHWPGL